MDEKLQAFLKNHKRERQNPIRLDQPPSEAAVIALLAIHEGKESLFFTKRSEIVEHHKGQICFPGGVRDATDETLWDTALRELEEEVGIQKEAVVQIGELAPVVTPTGFRITPFLARLTQPVLLKPSEHEIAEAFFAPLDFFLDPKNLQIITRDHLGYSYQDTLFQYGDHRIWGATGRIVADFLEVLKSVAHTL